MAVKQISFKAEEKAVILYVYMIALLKEFCDRQFKFVGSKNIL